MTDKLEYILTVEVLKFLTNPLNDSALLAILESPLSMRAGIGKSVIQDLKQIVSDANSSAPLWNVLQDMVQRAEISTRRRNAIRKLIAWYHR